MKNLIEKGKKVYNGIIEKVDNNIVYVFFDKWQTKKVLYKNVTVKFDISYLMKSEYEEYDFELYQKTPDDKEIFGEIV